MANVYLNIMKLKTFFAKSRFTSLAMSGAFLMLFACTSIAPVQEMSNARQTLRAADQMRASYFAPELFGAARDLLQAAEAQLAKGEYEQAKTYALAARAQALRAQQKALSKQRE